MRFEKMGHIAPSLNSSPGRSPLFSDAPSSAGSEIVSSTASVRARAEPSKIARSAAVMLGIAARSPVGVRNRRTSRDDVVARAARFNPGHPLGLTCFWVGLNVFGQLLAALDAIGTAIEQMATLVLRAHQRQAPIRPGAWRSTISAKVSNSNTYSEPGALFCGFQNR